MAVKLNSKGNSNARKLIKAGKVNASSSWSFSAADGNKILGDDNWSEYAKWHLAIDDSAEADTKEHYKYPFGKNGKVYRSALRAIRSRAAQQKVTDVFEAAGRLMDLIDKAKKGQDMKDMAERRSIPTELRVVKDDKGNSTIVGLAAVFDKFSENLGGFVERIEPGAFTEALKNSDARALFNHDANYVLGRESAGTLEIKQSKHGLDVAINPPDTQFARDIVTGIERGDIQGMSFGFRVAPNGDSWEETDDGRTIRTINEIKDLLDVSVVTFPAYPDTKVALRSLEEWRAQNNDDTTPPDATIKGEQDNDSTPTHRVKFLRRKLDNKLRTIEMKEAKNAK